MSSRNRRWRPKGQGFRCIFDSGTAAMWLRREDNASLTCVVYLDWDWPDRDGIWTLRCDPGAWMLYDVIDKPHRVGWILTGDSASLGAELLSRVPVPSGPERRSPRIRGRRHGRRRIQQSPQGWLLPRKYRR